ncbi:MAG: hypothetical protein ABJC55_11160, partial [Algoriphagus sp.]
FLACVLIASMLVFSCDMNDSPEAPVPELSVVEENSQVISTFEDVDYITLSALSSSGLNARTTVDLPGGNLCDGTIIKLDNAAKLITIDFGAGCTNNYGVVRKGKVKIAYTANLLFPGSEITTTFEGYEVDGLKVEGTRKITNKGVNGGNNSITLGVSIQNGKVTWPNATFFTINSEQQRVITLGTQGAYEVSITGTAAGKSREGVDYITSTNEPLIYTKNCMDSGITYPIGGIQKFQFLGIEVSVDYGDETCDKLATVFYPGGSKAITLD